MCPGDDDREEEIQESGGEEDCLAERFVLDDGSFRHRRDDYAGLGDWYVDEDVWPQGLHPLVDHVRSLGCGSGCGSSRR
jgi:alpha-galactosidase